LAENYRIELAGVGIDSCIVEPGGYPTTFMNNLLKPGDPSWDASYGEFAQAPMGLFVNFEKALKNNEEQNSQNLADAVADLIDTPAGRRPFRTIVDKMVTGDQIESYNDQLEQPKKTVIRAQTYSDAVDDAVIEANGKRRGEKHHEIYPSDRRKADPSKWKIVIRQPNRVTVQRSER
jgi:hypothetical protein